jgi:hypothetical protein
VTFAGAEIREREPQQNRRRSAAPAAAHH